MFLAVILEDKTLKCIPIKWCFKILVANTFNYGIDRHEHHRIFYSSDGTKEANFLLPIKRDFDPADDGCYLAYIKRCFDAKTDCDLWLERQRGTLPAVYNAQRAAASANLHLAGEKQVQEATDRTLDIKFEVKKEIALREMPFQKVVKALNDLLPSVHDLTESETEDFQNALVISDDEMDTFERGSELQLHQKPDSKKEAHPEPSTQKDPKSTNDEDEPYDIVTGNLRFRVSDVIRAECFCRKPFL